MDSVKDMDVYNRGRPFNLTLTPGTSPTMLSPQTNSNSSFSDYGDRFSVSMHDPSIQNRQMERSGHQFSQGERHNDQLVKDRERFGGPVHDASDHPGQNGQGMKPFDHNRLNDFNTLAVTKHFHMTKPDCEMSLNRETEFDNAIKYKSKKRIHTDLGDLTKIRNPLQNDVSNEIGEALSYESYQESEKRFQDTGNDGGKPDRATEKYFQDGGKPNKPFQGATKSSLDTAAHLPEAGNPSQDIGKPVQNDIPVFPETISNNFAKYNDPYLLKIPSLPQNDTTPKVKKPYECDVCHKGFARNSDLTKHARIHTDERPFECDVCGKSFNRSCSLSEHKRIHSGDKPFICGLCNKTFYRNSDLHKHMRIHSGERPYECETCGKTFALSCNLKSHMFTHTGVKPFSCKICGKSFNRNSNLQTHLKSHSSEKPFECGVCGNTFKLNTHLQTHLETHSGQRPYSCDLCDRSFNRSSNLQAHMIIHTGTKSFECDVCGKTFYRNGNLQAHLKTHFKPLVMENGVLVPAPKVPEKPVECEFCLKIFFGRSTYMRHRRIHTGYKPHHCNVCGKSFTLSHHLKRHSKTHTPKEIPLLPLDSYPCGLCGFIFEQLSDLENHIKFHIFLD